MNLNTLINANKRKFNIKFKKLLKNKLDKSSLSNAIFYGSMNGGKRIRPFLVMESAKIAKISSNDAFIIASCVECIHSYSLIHDDLPSMDNDDYRRGKLSTHKKFNEATAILAGDALHDLAFELISGNFKNKNVISGRPVHSVLCIWDAFVSDSRPKGMGSQNCGVECQGSGLPDPGTNIRSEAEILGKSGTKTRPDMGILGKPMTETTGRFEIRFSHLSNVSEELQKKLFWPIKSGK